jgi:hypothetical protein
MLAVGTERYNRISFAGFRGPQRLRLLFAIGLYPVLKRATVQKQVDNDFRKEGK